MEVDSRLDEGLLLSTLHCCLYAQTYVIWSAEGITNVEQPETVLSIGNDIADVDESYLTSCLAAAVALSPSRERTVDWLNSLIARMEREHRKTPTSVLGPRPKRGSFTVPPITG
jgi:hypothetical protein